MKLVQEHNRERVPKIKYDTSGPQNVFTTVTVEHDQSNSQTVNLFKECKKG